MWCRVTLCTGLELSDCAGDFIEHCVEIVVDVFVHYAMKSDSKRFDVMLPVLVVDSSKRSKMAIPVDLNREFQFRAIEVDNELVDAVLSPELVAEHLPV